MKKFFVLLGVLSLVMMTSCGNNIKKESAVYKYLDSEIVYCEPSDEGHYEVSLTLENGENFKFHTEKDVTKIDKEMKVNVGYNKDEKVYVIAVIEPSK